MLIIPVIDLMGGEVVHARRGDRANYKPLKSQLAYSTNPLEVVTALLDAAPFPILYLADLDAILRRASHSAVIREIGKRYPSLTLWLDAGFSEAAELEPWNDLPNVVPVIGSETLLSMSAFEGIRAVAPNVVLSLDTRGADALGPQALFADVHFWPERVIVMTLDRVGAGSGPAVGRLQTTLTQAPDRYIVAAGGVRNVHDLDALEGMGVHAVLLASAIHDGSLDRSSLNRFLA